MPRISRAALYTFGSSLAVILMAICGVVIDNPGEMALASVMRPLAAFTAMSLAIVTILFAAGGRFRVAALTFPIMLFAFFSFVGFFAVGEFLGLTQTPALILAAAGFAFVTFAGAQSFRRRDPEKLASFIFAVTGAMAIGSVVSAGMIFFKLDSGGMEAASKIAAGPQVDLTDAALPDIIYIVPDRYGSAETLARHFNHDNREFLAALEQRGFFVAPKARSNFAKTVSSLSSTLNMSDLAPLTAAMDKTSSNRGPLHLLLRDYAAQRILQDAGYTYEHLGNWWEPTRANPNADALFYGIDTLWSSLNEFERALLRLTPVSWLATDGSAQERSECERLQNQLTHLESARARSAGPVFVFAHLTMPHDPITMDRDGVCIPHVYYPGYGTKWEDYQSAYSGYVTYLNRRLLEIFDANRAAKRDRGLIFVVQADEGPYPRRLQVRGDMVMQDFTDEEVREKFGIINALYWDKDEYGAPHLTETPINNWRIILSAISGEKIPLVADERSLLMYSDKLVYDLKDVTGVLAVPAPTGYAASSK